MEWFQGKVNALRIIDNIEEKKEIAVDLKIKLTSLTNLEIEQVFRNLDFTVLLSQLTSNDDIEYLEHLCDIVRFLISNQQFCFLLDRYPDVLLQLINSPEVLLRTLSLEDIDVAVKKRDGMQQLLKNTDLMTSVIGKIEDSDLSVAQRALKVLEVIGSEPESRKVLLSGACLNSLKDLLTKDDVVKFRLYELTIDIAKSSPEGLEASLSFLHNLLQILDNDDVLLQMSALETLSDLALTEHGLNYLDHQLVLHNLSQKVAQAEENPLSGILIPGLMKFLGKIARFKPDEIFSKYPVLITALFDVIENGESTMLASALDTLGHIASTLQGKYALQSFGDFMPRALRKIAEIIEKMPTDLRVRGLNNLALILEVKKEEQDNRILSLTKSWFDCLREEDPLNLIVGLCRQPFADIRQAGLEVLRILADQTWGQEYIAGCPGLIEFLLDRNVESFKECKDVKYTVVESLAKADSNIFDAGTVERFKNFVREGPYFVETHTEVAFEGAT